MSAPTGAVPAPASAVAVTPPPPPSSPPATRRASPRWKDPLLVAGVALILVAVIAGGYVAYQLLFPPPPPDYRWVLESAGARALRDRGLEGAGVVVCMLDTGIDPSNPWLRAASIVSWKDFIAGKSEPYDDNGHGSYMASLVAGSGPAAVAPKVSLVVGKVIKSDGDGSDSSAADGVQYCIDRQADIISLSLGGRSRPFLQSKTEERVTAAAQTGIFVVAAAGNEGPDNEDVASPASATYSIAVGAVDRNGKIAPFSSKGDNSVARHPPFGRQDPHQKPETVAPGVDIPGAWKDGGSVVGDGTSQATAIVSGVLALLLDAHPEYRWDGAKGGNEARVQAFKSLLMGSCRKAANQDLPHDVFYGYGRIDAVKLESMM